MNEKMKIEAPWYAFNKKLKALFELDPDIEVGDIYEPDVGSEYACDILVKKHEKFKALEQVLPDQIQFGNVTMCCCLQDMENVFDDDHPISLYAAIFDGNPIVKDIKEVRDQTGTTHGYVRFQPEVVQFFHDDISDYNGNWTGLAQDIAKEAFVGNAFIHFCTAGKNEADGEVVKPLGEWP